MVGFGNAIQRHPDILGVVDAAAEKSEARELVALLGINWSSLMREAKLAKTESAHSSHG